jgi:hypothetical protein
MSLLDKAAKKLALRWAGGKIKALRGKGSETTMGKLLKLLDGWKLVIAVVLIAAAKAWDMAHNGHAGDAIGIVLSLFGYTPGADWALLARDMGAHILALAAIAHKLVKAQKQVLAGARATEVLSPEGAVKQVASERGLRTLFDVAEGK